MARFSMVRAPGRPAHRRAEIGAAPCRSAPLRQTGIRRPALREQLWAVARAALAESALPCAPTTTTTTTTPCRAGVAQLRIMRPARPRARRRGGGGITERHGHAPALVSQLRQRRSVAALLAAAHGATTSVAAT